MTPVEITLIIIGIVFVLGSFFIKDKLSRKDLDTITDLTEKELKIIVDKQLQDANHKVVDFVDEAIDATSDKTKRDIERTTNEKIMAINEYSDTVLDSINKSHNEVMFLYSMLNDKHSELTGLCGQLQRYSDKIQTMIEEENLLEKTQEASENGGVVEMVSMVEETEEKPEMDSVSEIHTSARNHNMRILELHNSGYSDVDIAKELNLGLGEVKLVIGLFKGES